MKTLHEQQTRAVLEMANTIKLLEQQLAAANDRIRQLEAQVYGGTTK